MKRWFWLSAAALLAFSACNDQNKKSDSTNGSAASNSRPARGPSPSRDAQALSGQALAFADGAVAPSDEAATRVGDRFFDGAALRGAGFSLPDSAPAVYAGASGTRRPPLTLTSGRGRAASDLTGSAPPLPDMSGSYPEGSAAQSRGAGKVLAAFDSFQRSMFDQAAPILSRAGWGAVRRKGSPEPMTPTHVTVHHTEGAQTMSEAETAAAVRGIQHYHMAGRAAEGKDVWDDIGYHFLIDGAGRVIEGRPAETYGAHTAGANANNVGVALMGNFNKIQPTAAQVESLTRLVSFLAIKYRQRPSRPGFLEGHRHYNNTDCPGKNLAAMLDGLRARIDSETNELEARAKAAPKGEFVPLLTDA
jgi:hypothetical protein